VGREQVTRRVRAAVLSLGLMAAAVTLGAPAAQAVPTVTLQQTATTAPVSQSVGFTATASTDDGAAIASYAWTFGDGATGAGASTSHAYAAPGTYPVAVTVTDANGLTASASGSVSVLGPPVAAFTSGPATPSIGDPVTFDAAGSSDPGGAALSYTWDFGDGSAPASGARVTHRYATGGDKAVTLTVATPDGRSASAGHTVHIDTPPVAGFDVAPAAPVAGQTVTLTSTASDADGPGDITTTKWDLDGDGAFDDATGPTATFFTTAGSHKVGQRVVDKAGAGARLVKTIVVGAAPATSSPSSGAPAGTSSPAAGAPSPGSPVTTTLQTPDASPTGGSGTSTVTIGSTSLKVLRVRVQLAGSVTGTRTRITRLVVVAPRGALVVARCSGKGKGCPTRGARRQVGAAGSVRLATMERRLSAGAQIVLAVSRRGYATRRIVLTIRDGSAPARRDACLSPTGGGAAKEGRCPAA
jgi:large repetitive protein